MAKTTTRPKPATAKKTEATELSVPGGGTDIRMIPLDQLEPSPLNVRKVAASASDDAELLVSIRETGIKQNLVVHALSETRFAVDAGGRRLKSLKQLAEERQQLEEAMTELKALRDQTADSLGHSA